MDLTREVFNDISRGVKFCCYEEVTPACKAVYRAVYDFMMNGEFIGFEFKGVRGNPGLGIARVSTYPNVRAKTYLLFKHEKKMYKVLYSHGLKHKSYGRLVREIAGSYYKHYMSTPGVLSRHYKKMLLNPVEGSNLVSVDYITELLKEKSSVDKAQGAIEKYVLQHQKVSSALKNNLVNRFPKYIDSRSLVESFYTVAMCAADCQAMGIDQDVVVKLLRVAMRHHSEIKHFNDAVKDEIINARLVGRVHT